MPTPTELDPRRGLRYVQRAIRKSPAYHRMEQKADELSEQLDQVIADGRKAVRRTARQVRDNAEEFADETKGRIRKAPFRSVGIAAATGVALGALLTATVMMRWRRRRARWV